MYLCLVDAPAEILSATLPHLKSPHTPCEFRNHRSGQAQSTFLFSGSFPTEAMLIRFSTLSFFNLFCQSERHRVGALPDLHSKLNLPVVRNQIATYDQARLNLRRRESRARDELWARMTPGYDIRYSSRSPWSRINLIFFLLTISDNMDCCNSYNSTLRAVFLFNLFLCLLVPATSTCSENKAALCVIVSPPSSFVRLFYFLFYRFWNQRWPGYNSPKELLTKVSRNPKTLK